MAWKDGSIWKVKGLYRKHSDHIPLVLFVSSQEWGPKPVRAFDTWLNDDGFIKLMQDSLRIGERENLSLHKTLKFIRGKMPEWNKRVKGELDAEIAKLEQDLQACDKTENVNRATEIASTLRCKYAIKDDIIRQKSRINLARDGDKNSKFFHGMVKKRQMQNRVKGTLQGDKWITDPSQVKEIFVEHFQQRFAIKASGRMLKIGSLFTNRLSQGQAELLQSPFSEGEVQLVLKDLGGSKAPGPNGFNINFIKSMWEGLEGKIMSFIQSFHQSGFIPKGINSSFITLIPKCEDPKSVGDYRPISLINSTLKIILKMMANRLKKCLQYLISKVQSAFVKERQIVDCVLIAGEIVHSMKIKSTMGVILKIDFEKAFDCVEWGCMLDTLSNFGFPEKWKKWISSILSSARLSVLVNGSPSKEFKMSRVVRQGDPLSPQLFILVTEILNLMLEKAKKKNIIKGMEVDALLISHLQFVDDMILFLQDSWSTIRRIKCILILFEIISGLTINFSKSKIYIMNEEQDNLTAWSEWLGCQRGECLIQYLGASLESSPLRKAFWKPLTKKIRCKLSNWKCSTLSKSGRLVLIRAVLDSIPSYWINLYQIHKGILKEVEKIKSRLFRGETHGLNAEVKKLHLIRWEVISTPKSKGGLGVKVLAWKNQALLAKWRWRARREKGKLWHKLMTSKYGENFLNKDHTNRKSESNMFRNISSLKKTCELKLFEDTHFQWNVGNGNSILFWKICGNIYRL